MGEIIYNYGAERIGTKSWNRRQKGTSAQPMSRRQKEIGKLVKKRRHLRKQWKKAREEEREGLEALQSDIKQRLAREGAASCEEQNV